MPSSGINVIEKTAWAINWKIENFKMNTFFPLPINGIWKNVEVELIAVAKQTIIK